MKMTTKGTQSAEEFEKFDKAMDKIMPVSKKELDFQMRRPTRARLHRQTLNPSRCCAESSSGRAALHRSGIERRGEHRGF
jgi:hypothetical protein